MNCLFYCIFLTLFSYVIMVKFCDYPSKTELILFGWYLTFVLDEQRQVLHEPGNFWIKTRNWWKSGYNKFDAAAYILLGIGFCLRAMYFSGHPEALTFEESQCYLRSVTLRTQLTTSNSC